MRVLMLSDREWDGGAAHAAGWLAQGLVMRGHHVTRIVGRPSSGLWLWDSKVLRPQSERSRFLRAIRATLSSRWRRIWNGRFARLSLQQALQESQPDVISVHNLHAEDWPPSLVRICASHAPTVWTLHDQWSFTGRCGYSYDCTKFVRGCDSDCPTACEYPVVKPAEIAREWRLKSDLLRGSGGRIVGVTPSKWLLQVAKAGAWSGRRVEVIPYGLPLSIYAPLDRSLARKALGLERSDEPVILAAADDLSDRRKGIHILVEALRDVGPATLLTFGSGTITAALDNIRIRQLGRLDHERTKALAYSAADVLVHPSLADNLPCTVMEAISCGTPAIGFRLGGVPELVRPDVTGWLAREPSAPALRDAIKNALSASGLETIRERCRRVAMTEYSLDLQAQKYERLFNSLCTESAFTPMRQLVCT